MTLSSTVHATPSRALQLSPVNLRSAELGLTRERTKRSASLKSIQASPAIPSPTGSTSALKKLPPGSLPASSLVPPSPFATQPARPPVVNHDKAIATLSAELLSNILESSISQVAQNTLLKRSIKASAEQKMMTEKVISHFSRSLEERVLSEVVEDIIFDLASSSLLAIHHTKQQRALLKSTFQKWKTISRSCKSKLTWKVISSARVQSLAVGDLSSIWNPGKMKKVVSQYLYRKVLSTHQLSIREIRVLVITPIKAPVVQAWLRCKFDIAAGQSRTQSSINEVSFSMELVDQHVDLQELSRYDLILVWQEPTDQTNLFSTQIMETLQARSLHHICCLGISWQTQQPNMFPYPDGRDRLDQVYLSLETPEVQLEQALQDRWPVPLVNTALSMNNADRLLPLTHSWRGVHRKAVSLLHAYVPVNDFGVTIETKSQLKTWLLKFSVDVLKGITEHVSRMLHPPDDALLSSVVQALRIAHLSDIRPDNVDRLLSEYQSSLPLGTFSFNLLHLFESQTQLSLVEFFQLFGQHLLAAWLDSVTAYLQTSSSTDSDLDSPRTPTRVLVSPRKTDSGLHEQAQLRPKLDSLFQLLQRQVIAIFPRPLTLDHAMISDTLSVRDTDNHQIVEEVSPRNKKKRKADRLAELRLLVTQTREGLRTN